MSESPVSQHAAAGRSPELLNREWSHLLVVDVQEKLLPVVAGSDDLLQTILFLLDAAKILQVPVCVSEQYPQGLGPTVSEICEHPAAGVSFQKLRFSAAAGFHQLQTAEAGAEARAQPAVRPATPDQVVIVGIEAHICVLQTALDLLAQGRRVFVVQDAVASRQTADHDAAMDRIRDSGGVICTAESVVFEWCEVAGTDEFRQISRLVRNRTSTSEKH
ncbi:MAG: isochorismatase family protein [Fuerstiella sp.]